jgi:effector-binding domain-containing protein
MSYECEVREQHAQPTLTVRTRAAVQDMPQVLGQAFGRIAQYLGELGEHPAGPPFVAYHNEDMDDLDLEIGFQVARELPGRDDVEPSEIPGGKAATCLHVGPYSDIKPAYEALWQFVADEGYEASGVAYEMYLNDPQETPPEELQTQISFPLK